MVTLCWAAKGGSGTTVVTSTMALGSPRPALLVDLAGEIPTVLGLPEPDRPGVVDWLRGDGPPAQLTDLVADVNDTTALLPCRLADSVTEHRPVISVGADRWQELVDWLVEWEQRHGGDVMIDGGTGCPNASLADAIEHRWLVTRACYLALRLANRSAVAPTGVVLVQEAGRCLTAADVERALAAPIVASVGYDPKVARSVDMGLLQARPPYTIRRALRRAAA